MLAFLKKSEVLGIEVTPFAVRAVLLSGRRGQRTIRSAAKADLPPLSVSVGYALPNVQNENLFQDAIRGCFRNMRPGTPVALSLPDSMFRVQILEFDQLPQRESDRERLIRWRLEKAACFDVADTQLRYQVISQKSGFAVLACFAKQAVIVQYENLLRALNCEPWSVGVSSFHALNFYAPYFAKHRAPAAVAHVAEDSFTTIVVENGNPRFYRFKDLKRAGTEDWLPRMVREIDDSLHFFTHMDRTRQPEVGRLYLTGERETGELLAAELRKNPGLSVETLVPGQILKETAGAGPEMAAALGAGRAL